MGNAVLRGHEVSQAPALWVSDCGLGSKVVSKDDRSEGETGEPRHTELVGGGNGRDTVMGVQLTSRVAPTLNVLNARLTLPPF